MIKEWFWQKVTDWLNKTRPPEEVPLSHFEALIEEAMAADVILVEGRTRVSTVIQYITMTPWSHAALYIGKISEIEDESLYSRLVEYGAEEDQVYVLESLLGEGMVLTAINEYQHDHIRICRARGLTRKDAMIVVKHAAEKLGFEYDTRQLFDLARFLLPYSLLPKRWRSSLFAHNPGSSFRTVCSTAIAEAFMAVRFPILPIIRKNKLGEFKLNVYNPKLITPRAFDYSPYFEVIKHPFIDFPTSKFLFFSYGAYRDLPWEKITEQSDGKNEYHLANGEDDDEDGSETSHQKPKFNHEPSNIPETDKDDAVNKVTDKQEKS
ncbi:MAG: YiiX/YebB-like N1pC/P60 family cysteine hydrolase [Ostreibacterium sp.]